ncbi:MAG: N-acetyltransferase [Proteobacteria bacterium]|nr:N-acetyltransferase [Pseudomonadota bacterium]
MNADVAIRAAQPDDVGAIAAIYGHHVTHGTGSFELEAPSVADMAGRMRNIADAGYPWLVAARDGEVLGYAYAGIYRPRLAYRFAAEDSVYLAPSAIGQGVGRALLAALIDACTARGDRQMLAVIGDSANAASIGLHAAFGFTHVGVLKAVGRKFDRWLDVVLMQRALGHGASSPPTR